MQSNLILQFNKEPGKVVEEFKLRAIYVLANHPCSSSRATTDLGVSSKDLLSIHPKDLNFSCKSFSNPPFSRHLMVHSKFFSISNLETFHFPFFFFFLIWSFANLKFKGNDNWGDLFLVFFYFFYIFFFGFVVSFCEFCCY